MQSIISSFVPLPHNDVLRWIETGRPDQKSSAAVFSKYGESVYLDVLPLFLLADQYQPQDPDWLPL